MFPPAACEQIIGADLGLRIQKFNRSSQAIANHSLLLLMLHRPGYKITLEFCFIQENVSHSNKLIFFQQGFIGIYKDSYLKVTLLKTFRREDTIFRSSFGKELLFIQIHGSNNSSNS